MKPETAKVGFFRAFLEEKVVSIDFAINVLELVSGLQDGYGWLLAEGAEMMGVESLAHHAVVRCLVGYCGRFHVRHICPSERLSQSCHRNRCRHTRLTYVLGRHKLARCFNVDRSATLIKGIVGHELRSTLVFQPF
jgi:hypothetical protein